MSLGAAELGPQKSLNQVPSDRRPNRPAAHANNIHVIVFNALHGREVVVNDRGSDAVHLVGAHRSANATAADRHAALYLSRDDRARQRHDEIGIVVRWIQAMGAEIDDLMPRRAQVRRQTLASNQIRHDPWQCQLAYILLAVLFTTKDTKSTKEES